MQPLVAVQSGSVVLLGLIAHLLDRQVLRLRLRSEFAKYDRLRRGFGIDSNRSHSESIPHFYPPATPSKPRIGTLQQDP